MSREPVVLSSDGDRTTGLARPVDTTQRPSAPRRYDVQGLRAVAVLLVVAFHSGLPIPGGFVGVDVFFVISGYVIIALLYYEVSGSGSISLARFFERRVRRILPALSLLATVTVVGAWFWLSPLGTQQVTATTAKAAALLYANWSIMNSTGDYFAEAAGVNPLLHTWSLSVEEQFYIVFPSLLALTWMAARRRSRSGRAAVLTLLGGLGAVSFLLAFLFTGPVADTWPDSTGWAFYGSFFRAWEFAVGGLIAVAVRRRPAAPPQLMVATGVAGMAAVVLAALVIDGSTPFPGVWTLLPVLGTGAVIYAGSGLTAGVVPGLASRPMVWLGDLSYSWYLWHWPAIVFTSVLTGGSQWMILLAGFGSLLPAWLSYRFLEQPIRHSRIRGRQAVALAAVCMAVPVTAAATLQWHADQAVQQAAAVADNAPTWRIGYVNDDKQPPDDLFDAALLAQRGQWEVYDEPCLAGGKSPKFGSCTFFDGAGKPRALLIGDSHAGAYSPGFLAAANSLGYSAEVSTSGGCPFTGVPIGRGGTIEKYCEDRFAAFWDYVEKNPPDVVAIANRSPRFVSPTVLLNDELQPGFSAPCVADPDTSACLDHDAAVAAWADSLRSIATRLEKLGSQVVVLQTVPENEKGLESCVVGTSVHLGCLETPRSLAWDRRVDVITAEKDVADQAGFVAWDPFDLFCDADTCHQFIDGWFRYRNDDHLNPAGSEMLAPGLTTMLSSLGRS